MAFQADGDNMMKFRLNHGLKMSDDDVSKLHPKFRTVDADGNVLLKQFTQLSLPRRKENYNTQGKKVLINVNQFKIESWPENNVAQFDVSATPNNEHDSLKCSQPLQIKVTPASGEMFLRFDKNKKPIDTAKMMEGITKKVWDHAKVKEWRERNFDRFWIWDGKKIAWYVILDLSNPRNLYLQYTGTRSI